MASVAEIGAERAKMLARFRSMVGGTLVSEKIEAKEFSALTADDWHYCLRTLDVTRDAVANLTIELRRSEEYAAELRRQNADLYRENIALRGEMQTLASAVGDKDAAA